jgi:hypothetical protein
VLFILKYIKIIILFLKKLFLTSAHQNDLKKSKTYKFKAKKKKFLKFFKSTFLPQCQTLFAAKPLLKVVYQIVLKAEKYFASNITVLKAKNMVS